jgi:hypothetical protein
MDGKRNVTNEEAIFFFFITIRMAGSRPRTSRGRSQRYRRHNLKKKKSVKLEMSEDPN